MRVVAEKDDCEDMDGELVKQKQIDLFDKVQPQLTFIQALHLHWLFLDSLHSIQATKTVLINHRQINYFMQLQTYLRGRKKNQHEQPKDKDQKENLVSNRRGPSHAKGSLQEVITQQRDTIAQLKKELEQKLVNHGFANFFKTLNSSQDLSHIDIYLQLVNIKARVRQQDMHIKQLEAQLDQKDRQYHALQQDITILEQEATCDKERYQQQFRKATEAIRKAHERIQSLTFQLQSQHQSEHDQQKYEQLKLLSDQIEKQRLSLIAKNKDLTEQIAVMRDRQKDILERACRDKDELHRVELEADRISGDNHRVIRENKELQALNKELGMRLEECEKERGMSEQKSIRDMRTIESLRGQIKQAATKEHESFKLQLQLKEMESDFESQRIRNKGFEGKIKALSKNIEDLQLELQQERGSKETARESSQRIASQNKQLADQMKMLNERCGKLRNTLLLREEQISELHSEIGKSQSSKQQVEEDVQLCLKEKAELTALLSKLAQILDLHSYHELQHNLIVLRDKCNDLQLVDQLKEEMLTRFKPLLPKDALPLISQYHELLIKVAAGCTEAQFQTLSHKKRQLMIEIEGVIDDLTCREAYVRNLQMRYEQAQKELQGTRREKKTQDKREERRADSSEPVSSKRQLIKRFLK